MRREAFATYCEPGFNLLFVDYSCINLCRRYLAANGAVMRTSILGVLNFNGDQISY